MKKIVAFSIVVFIIAACGNNNTDEKKEASPSTETKETTNGNPSYDPNRGQ